MNSSAHIKAQLEGSRALDLALVIPAVTTGLGTLDTAYTLANTYSPEAAAEIPMGAESGLWRRVSLGLTPLFLAFGWVAFFKSFKLLWQAKERGFELWMNTSISFIAASGSTLAMIFLLTSLTPIVPYLLVAILGLNVLQGLYYTTKYLLFAYQDKGQRWQHMREAGKHFLSIATNTLAMVLNLLMFQTAQLITGAIKEYATSALSLFLHYAELVNLINGPVKAAVSVMKAVGLAWLGTFMFSLIIAASKINRQSWHMIQRTYPEELTFEREAKSDMMQVIKTIGNPAESVTKRIFLALTAPIILPLYGVTAVAYFSLIRPLAALVVGIPELIGRGLYRAMKCHLFSKKEQTNSLPVVEEISLERSDLVIIPNSSKKLASSRGKTDTKKIQPVLASLSQYFQPKPIPKILDSTLSENQQISGVRLGHC